jgi:putative addiction module killer protein
VLSSGERELRLYQTADGRIPFSEWFEELRDERTKQRIDARLARVRLGNLGDSKSTGGGVYELRIDFGPGFRIYFGEDAGRIIILLCGGDKSSQQNDIRRARLYWADYKQRRA